MRQYDRADWAYDHTQWAEAAVRGIVSRTERERAKQELLDHMADHTEALQAAGMSRGRALEEACAAMGDSAEVARLLRKAHQPVLTWLVRLARWLAIALAVFAAWQMWSALREGRLYQPRLLDGDPSNLYGYFELEAPDEDILYRRVVEVEGNARMGDYTVTARRAAIDEEAGEVSVSILLDFRADSILQDAPVMRGTLTLEADGQITKQQVYFISNHRNLRHHYMVAGAPLEADPRELTRLTLGYTTGGLSFTIPLDLRGGQVYEKAP